MGHRYTKLQRFRRLRSKSKDSLQVKQVEEAAADSINHANFSWLHGRKVSDEKNYVLPKDGVEFDRLTNLHLLWKYVLRGNHQAPLNPNMKNCLEICVGNGVWIKEMASQFPDCRFEGIDPDLSISSEDLPSNCTVTKGDYTALPYPNDHFDYIHCRLCFTWLPSNKIGPILDEFKRVTKPEGWIEILELDLYPRNTGSYYDNWKGTWKLLNDSKLYDVKAIRSLGESLRTRNLVDVTDNSFSMPIGNYCGTIGKLWADHLQATFQSASGAVLEHMTMNLEDFNKFIENMLDEFNEKQSFSNVHMVLGKKPKNEKQVETNQEKLR